MNRKCLILVAVSILISFTAYADENESGSVLASSSWTNQNGSTLIINSIYSNGMLTGQYINREAGWNCQNTPYPVTGWVYGSAITFATR